MSFETQSETERGWPLSSREWTVIGGASALMALTVALMSVFVATPLAVVNDYLFAAPIVGVLVYGAAITGGHLLAERGLEGGDTGVAFLGVVVLLVAFGTFGAGVISFAPPAERLTILAVTAVVVTLMTAVVATYVYARSSTFESWNRYATVAFVAGLVAIGIGTFVLGQLLVVGFVCIFLGFLFRLGWEIWRVRDRRVENVALQTVGVYIAVAGVFVHVLQLVMRVLSRR
ncbi:hypothetical protein [Natronobiforma cellulositropha]|uniref:hypothetical protein n=1 Tax=Natronobiforma cellulositropha TaxID=1679076 RepID=UPI0021D58D38|nr:hypothetical protein [Natronobiforma cellulositropha]